MTCTVRPLTRDAEDAYRAFLAGSPDDTLYASLEFRDFLTAAVGGTPMYLTACDDGRIVGALPALVSTAPGVGLVVNSLPWYGSHGGCVLAAGAGHEVRAALLRDYLARVSGAPVLSATMILLPGETENAATYREILDPAAEDSRIGQVTELPAGAADPVEAIVQGCLRKTRNLVRKALKQPFTVERRDDDEAWQFLHATHDTNLHAIGGRAKPWAHFAALRDCLPRAWRTIYVARLEGVPVAALLLIRYGRWVEYLTPAIVEAHRSEQPLSRLIVDAMADAVRDGYTRWNWGGTWSTQQSLYHFKRGWGAVDRPYLYLITSADHGRRLAGLRERLGDLFPYYYVYPFDQLA